jgi:hypothetical protein
MCFYSGTVHRKYLQFCGLFYDAVSILQVKASNDMTTDESSVRKALYGSSRGGVKVLFRFPLVTEETYENLSAVGIQIEIGTG